MRKINFKYIIFVLIGNLHSISFGQDVLNEYKTSFEASGAARPEGRASLDSLLLSSYLHKSLQLKFGDDISPDGRGVKDALLFKTQAPSVVLIMTNNGLGSGSLISSDGMILTNKHVVGDAKKVSVFFKPERNTSKLSKEFAIIGEVIKIDDVSDLAIVKIKDTPVGRVPVKFGTEEDIGIGLDVHAIGHPKGEYWTYTKGVISQYRPDFEWQGGENGSKHRANVIQTQTPINPGNSGGPLFLDSGVLVGVNSFKNSNAEGLNFAVSVDTVKDFLRRKGDRVNSSAVAKKKCEPKLLYDGRTDKNNAKTEIYDALCSGRKTIAFIYPDDITKPYLAILYRKKEDRGDAIIYSETRNDYWNISYWDNSFDNTFSTVGLHSTGELAPDKYVSRAEYEKGK